MYLSRVELNISNRETMRAIVSPKIFHGAVENSFDGNRRRKLWRIDNLNGRKYILILSEDIPNLETFAVKFGFEGKYETKDYSSLLNKISNGGIWHFRLTANPVVKSDGKVMAHVGSYYQKKWLLDRAESKGFLLNDNDFQIVYSTWYDFYKKSGDGSCRVRMMSVTFEGVLQVTDAEKFKEILCCGIGREKAYGQGLITVVGVGK